MRKSCLRSSLPNTHTRASLSPQKFVFRECKRRWSTLCRRKKRAIGGGGVCVLSSFVYLAFILLLVKKLYTHTHKHKHIERCVCVYARTVNDRLTRIHASKTERRETVQKTRSSVPHHQSLCTTNVFEGW